MNYALICFHGLFIRSETIRRAYDPRPVSREELKGMLYINRADLEFLIPKLTNSALMEKAQERSDRNYPTLAASSFIPELTRRLKEAKGQ